MADLKLRKQYAKPEKESLTFIKNVGGGINLAECSKEELQGLWDKMDANQRQTFFETEAAPRSSGSGSKTEGGSK